MRLKSWVAAWLRPVAVIVAITPASAQAAGIGELFGFDPFQSHLTLETPHFRISHEGRYAELARLAARHLEDAHRVLAPIMKWEPAFRTQVVIVDNSDFANGLAGAAGRLGMVLWTTPPDNWLSIAHYDDWFRMLCFHEYSHILNLDVTQDFYRLLRIFLGDSIRPNTLWQSWMLEGLATAQETFFTRAGRGRSSFYGMLRRGVWRAGMLEPVAQGGKGIGQIIGPRTIPPLGEVAYFFGHELMNEFAAGNPSKLGELSLLAGGSLPFVYNSNAREVSGRDWREIWDSWSEKARTRSQQEAAAVESAGKTELSWISSGNLNSFRAAISPDGRWMAYARERYDEQPILALRDLKASDPEKAERRLALNIGAGPVAFTASGDAVVYSTVHREGLYQFFSQLWVHDLQSDETYPLGLPEGVESLRAKEPDILGDRIVFTSASTGRIGVSQAQLEKKDGKYFLKNLAKVFESELLGRASTPRLSPDGTRIVFSYHRNAETQERLMLVDQTGKLQQLTTQLGDSSGVLDRFPVWLDAQTLVFSSNRSGIDNLYRYSLGDTARAAKNIEAKAITNVESAAWYPAVSPEGKLLATIYTPTGWNVAWIATHEVRPPQISNEPFHGSVGTERVAPAEPPSESDWQSRPYSVYPSILPRAWSPLFQSSLSGGLSIVAAVAGFDALDFHRYMASVGWDTGLGVPEGSLQYGNRLLRALITADATTKLQGITETSYQREDSLGLSLSLYRPYTWARLEPSIEWQWERVTAYSRSDGARLAQLYFVPQLRAKVDFTNLYSSRQAVVPEEGFNGTLGHQWSLGRIRTTHELLWNQGHFFHLGGHRVLWPRWQLAVSDASTVQVEGRRNQLLESFGSSDFDQLLIRGYPLRVFAGLKSAGVGSLDFRFPILRVEQGWSNRPFFFEVLHGLAFAETAALAVPGMEVTRLSSWGAGIRGDWLVLNIIPLVTSLEYHQGTNTFLGGKSELFFQFKLGSLSL